MKQFVFFAVIVSVAFSKPVHEDAIVDFTSDNAGQYKYSFKSQNITITEERHEDGSVQGSFSYLDENDKTQTVSYTSGVHGFVAVGTTIPVDEPEVDLARKLHLAISEKIRSILPPLNEARSFQEEDIIPLSKEELLAAVEVVSGADDTDEVIAAKSAFLDSYRTALAA